MMQKEPHQTPTAKHTIRESKIKRLLNNPDVKRWYDNLARSSPVTARNNLYRLGSFCEEHNLTPTSFQDIAAKDLKTAMDLMQDHIGMMEEKGYAPGYIALTIAAMQSWLRHFDIRTTRKFSIRNKNSTPTLEGERVPEGPEIAEVFNRAGLRIGVAISLIAKAGVRPEVLGNYNATDGLTMKDLPDIAIVMGIAVCLQSPPRIIVRRTISKARHQYFTFLTTQGTKRLLAYLNDRLANGEVLNAESAVIAPNQEYKYGRGPNTDKRFLPTNTITDLIRDVLRPRFAWRPYVLRAYYDTQLLLAEARGKIAHDFRVFFMGHKGSIEAKYTTNKSILPDALIKEMREAFKRSEESLDLEVKEIDPLLKQKEELHGMIEKATPEQMQKMFQSLSICNT